MRGRYLRGEVDGGGSDRKPATVVWSTVDSRNGSIATSLKRRLRSGIIDYEKPRAKNA